MAEKTVALWLPRGRYHDLAVSLGLISLPRSTYCAAVKDAEAQSLARGLTVKIVRVSPSRVVAELERRSLRNDPAGRAAAYAFLANEID